MVSFQRSSSRSVGDNDSLDSDSTPRRLNSSSSSWRQLQRRRNSGGGGSRRGSRGSTATLSRSGGSGGSCLSSSEGSSYSSSSSSWRSAASSRSSGASSCPSFRNPGEARGGRCRSKDSSIEVPRSRLTTRALRAFERSTEEHCRIVHRQEEGNGKIDDKADDVDFPTCLMVLPYELKPASEADGGSGGNRNRRGSVTSRKTRRKKKRNGDAEAPPPPPRRWVVANESDAELAERVGRCLLEVNAATARLSFHLRMHRVRAAHHGCNPEAFEALLRRWIARSRTEPPHLIATEIVTYLNCHPRYLGVCREMLLRQRCGDDERRRRSTDVTTDAGGGLSSCGDNGGGGGFCLLDDPDPVGAAAEELARATDDLRDCYREPTLTSKSGARAAPGGLRDRGVHYLYLVDEFRRSVASPASPSSCKGATSASGDSRDGGGDYSSSDDSNDMFGSMSLYPLRIGGGGGGDDNDQNGGRDEHDDDDDYDSSSSNHDALRSVFFPFMNLTVMTVASGAGDEGGDTLSGLARLLGLPPKSGSDGGVPESWVRAAGAGLIHGPGEGGYGYGGGGGCRGSLVEFARLQLDVERRRRAREAALRRQRRLEQKQVRFQVSQCSSSSSVGRGGYSDRLNDEDDISSSDGSASDLSSGSSPSFSPEWRQLQRFFRGRDPRGRYADLVRVVAVDEGVCGLSSYGLPSGSVKEFTSSSSSSTAIWTSRDVAVAIQRDDVRSIAAVAAARKEKRKNRTGNGGSRRRSSQEKLLSTAETPQGGQPPQGYGKAALIGGATGGGVANQNSTSACLTRACSMSNFLPSPFRGGKRGHNRFGGKVNASASTMDSSISSADLAGGGTAESIATRSIPSVIETKLSLQATKAAGSVRGALMRTSSMPKIGSSFRARFLGGGAGGGGPSKKDKKIGKRGSDGGASSRERDGYRSMGEGFDDFEEF